MAATIYLAKMDGEDHPSCHLAAHCPRSTATPKGSMSLLPSSNGLRILRHRNFSFYLSSRVLGTLAVQMQNVAIGWQVYALTHNLFDLGLIGLAQFAPFLLLILIAGHAADRYNRRNIIALCLSAQLLCGLLLLSFTLSGLSVVWPVFAVLALFGSARAFMMPASQAVMVNMVPPEEFSQAVALSSSSFHVAVIVGPTLGGLLYLAGPKAVYLLSSSLLVAAVILMWLTKPVPQASHLAQRARRLALRVVTAHRAGRHFARPVRRTVRRRHRAAAGAGARHAARRPDRPGPAAHGARRRRRVVLGRAGLLPAHAPGRPVDVRRRRAVRRRHHRAGRDRQLAGRADRAVPDGRRRHDQRLRAATAGAI